MRITISPAFTRTVLSVSALHIQKGAQALPSPHGLTRGPRSGNGPDNPYDSCKGGQHNETYKPCTTDLWDSHLPWSSKPCPTAAPRTRGRGPCVLWFCAAGSCRGDRTSGGVYTFILRAPLWALEIPALWLPETPPSWLLEIPALWLRETPPSWLLELTVLWLLKTPLSSELAPPTVVMTEHRTVTLVLIDPSYPLSTDT